MKMTDYFKDQVLRKRPYIRLDWCESAIHQPDYTILQPDGRYRFYKYIPELEKYIRVVTLEDRETVHNAFPDRDFKEDGK